MKIFIKLPVCRWAMLIALLMMSLGSAFAQTSKLWNGEWIGKNPEGDMIIDLTINCDKADVVNPYNVQSLSNGFVNISAIEPSGRKTVLSAYELTFKGIEQGAALFDYKSGRNGVDDGYGTCKAVVMGKTLKFDIVSKYGDKPLFAQVGFSRDGSAPSIVTTDEGITMDDARVFLIGLIMAMIYLGVFGHMIYLLFKGDRYKQQFTVSYMVSQRIEQGKPKRMGKEEYNQTVDLLENAFNQWSIDSTNYSGQELRKPTKMKQLRASIQMIDSAIAMLPTEENLVERINELAVVINSNEKRYFDGSKPLAWLGAIVGVVFLFIQPQIGIQTLIGTGIYLLASRTPAFLIDKRARRGGGNIHNGIIAGIFSMIAGARTVRTIYKYSDGHKEYENDYSQHWIAWIIGLALLMAIAMFIWLWAIINYLRNYILYI